jgi:hypothetical protein
MLIVLFSIILIILIVIRLINVMNNNGDFEDLSGMIFAISTILFILLAIIGCSYSISIYNKTFYETIRLTHSHAIEMYQDKVIINVDSLTDFRYSGHADNIKDLIVELRNNIYDYNKSLIRKRVVKQNIIFSWLIHDFDDLPLLELSDM